MQKFKMRDMIVLLPGITGSVLQKNGQDIWNFTGRPIWETLCNLRDDLQKLQLPDLAPGKPAEDGIEATALVQTCHGVFGLAKIEGYTALSNLILNRFEIIKGNLSDRAPANFIEFPYDWRQSNRISAHRLKALIDDRLQLWREASRNADAKVIFLAHSMGGLVSRYYLEVLDGWRDCKALVTFGTPYRGSIDALDYLKNGYKKLFINLSSVMRSFPSVYELLPIYKAIKDNEGKYCYVTDLNELFGENQKRATDAAQFHQEIKDHAAAHLKDPEYMQQRYLTFPVVGVAQPTRQSAELVGGKLIVTSTRPPCIEEGLDGGDGRVPRVSAIPIELSDEHREIYFAERHSSIHLNGYVLDDLIERLKTMQTRGLGNIRGTWSARQVRAEIGLAVEDLYRVDEPVTISATVTGGNATGLKAELTSAGDPGWRREAEFHDSGGQWQLTFPGLRPGQYRIKVYSLRKGSGAATPVRDVFEVADVS